MDSDEQRDHRPMPGPGRAATQTDDAQAEGSDIPEPREGSDGKIALDRSDESQDFVDQSKIDFDPDEGLYSGTAVAGTSEIPGPHADDRDEGGVFEQAKEMAGDDPPESEGRVGTMMRSRSKKEESDRDSDANEDRVPESSDEQAYN